ncbi:hypothetical protein F5Y16DRAFT_366200 [Xylariaceae sp. FL0255]|nr:hypothetical protein F5Y16DRAFT_366200 [Xylariaceae sp. FL0255]
MTMGSNTITQDNFLKGIEIDLFEASLDEGQTRSDEPDVDLQSEIIQDQGVHSKYKIQALLKTCVHGIWDATSKTPTSLLVVEYSVHNLENQGRCSSVTTRFEFAPYLEDRIGLPLTPEPLDTPSVKAWAPFATAREWDQTTATKENNHHFTANLEPSVQDTTMGNLTYDGEHNSSHEQRYFSRGVAGRHFIKKGTARGVPFCVWWNLQHNFSQKSGVPPTFRTAILLTRRAEAAKSKFISRFNIAVRGGFGMALMTLINRFLRRSDKPRPILFDPSIKFMGEKLNGLVANQEGEYELGHLAEGDELVKLSYVWGLSPFPVA